MIDVLVVGASIAGLTLAHCLERHGYRPVVVEKAPRLRDGGYMIDFAGPGYDVAEKLGLSPDLKALSYDIARMAFLDPTGRTKYSVGTAALRNLFDGRILNVLRGDLERLLYSKIKDCLEVRFDAVVESFEQDERRVRVTFANGQTTECGLLVGADGVHSAIRARTFGPEEQFARFVGYYAAAFILDRPLATAVAPDALHTLTLP